MRKAIMYVAATVAVLLLLLALAVYSLPETGDFRPDAMIAGMLICLATPFALTVVGAWIAGRNKNGQPITKLEIEK